MRQDSKQNPQEAESILDKIAWDKSPLIPTIVQDSKSKEVLMLGFSNRDSLALSLETSLAHYFSRSKNRIWQKGEESGNLQYLQEIYIDCDNDAILFLVNQQGNACHTGATSCFFKKIANGALQTTQIPTKKSPYHIIDTLYHILQERKFAPKDTSYTASLYAKGENAICKKIIEESGEVCFAIKDFINNKNEAKGNFKDSAKDSACKTAKKSSDSNDLQGKISQDSAKSVESNISLLDSIKSAVVYESADVFYHLLVGLSYCDISPDEVMSELKRRFGTSGIDEKNSRK